VGEQATSKGLDAWDMHCLLYEVAFALGDVAMMSDEVAKESGKQNEGWMLDYQALAAATAGKLKQARALFDRAIALSETSGGEDGRATISNFYTDYIQMLAMFELTREAQQVAAKAIGLEQNEEAPYALAEAGEFERAASLDREIGQQYPDSTLVSYLLRPRTQAAIALGKRRPRDAIVALQPAMPTKLETFDVPSMLGQAYLDLKQPEQAAAEFRDVLANRGVDAISPMYPFAYLGLARALRMQGKVQESRAAYEQLLAFWKDSDPDNPLLVRARSEYTGLGQ
jgi:tetratricopeptide (TPR) repeat protein